MKKIIGVFIAMIMFLSVVNVFAVENINQDEIIDEFKLVVCNKEDVNKEDINIRFIFNISDNKYLIKYTIKGVAISGVTTIMRLGEYKFMSSQPLPVVYVDGVIYDIKQAYQEKVLTDDDLYKLTTCNDIYLEKTDPILGDVNDSCNLDVFDATCIQRFLVKDINFEKITLELADFDLDGKVSVMDATAIQRHIVGLE